MALKFFMVEQKETITGQERVYELKKLSEKRRLDDSTRNAGLFKKNKLLLNHAFQILEELEQVIKN